MKVLVTGGAGYVGSHTVRLLRTAGHEVCVYDNLSTGHHEAVVDVSGAKINPIVGDLVVGDLADRVTLSALMQAVSFDAVVHFAGVASVAESVHQPLLYYQQNVANTVTLLDCLREHGISRLVVSSSCAVYGNQDRSPITEELEPRPISAYGRSKLMIEHMLEDCATAFGLGYTVLRYFNAAGAHVGGQLGEDHSRETHLIPLALQVAMGQRSHLDILGTDYPTADGTAIRDYVHVDDLADAHLAALENIRPGRGLCCNLGVGQGWSVREVIRTCEAITGQTIKLKSQSRRPGDAAALFADSSRARALLGWTPSYNSLEEIVSTAWRWHESHPGGYGMPGKILNSEESRLNAARFGILSFPWLSNPQTATPGAVVTPLMRRKAAA